MKFKLKRILLIVLAVVFVLESFSILTKKGGTEEFSDKTETVVLGSGSGAEVVVTQSRYPDFVGALVVCEGGGSAAVRLEITQALSALTGLPSSKISVIKGRP